MERRQPSVKIARVTCVHPHVGDCIFSDARSNAIVIPVQKECAELSEFQDVAIHLSVESDAGQCRVDIPLTRNMGWVACNAESGPLLQVALSVMGRGAVTPRLTYTPLGNSSVVSGVMGVEM